jgi:hypothetical protein
MGDGNFTPQISGFKQSIRIETKRRRGIIQQWIYEELRKSPSGTITTSVLTIVDKMEVAKNWRSTF